MNGGGEEKPAEQQPSESQSLYITFKVVDKEGHELYFKTKRFTPLCKMMDAYCNRQAKSLDSIRFLHNGRRVQPDSTPEDMEMKDEDAIIVEEDEKEELEQKQSENMTPKMSNLDYQALQNAFFRHQITPKLPQHEEKEEREDGQAVEAEIAADQQGHFTIKSSTVTLTATTPRTARLEWTASSRPDDYMTLTLRVPASFANMTISLNEGSSSSSSSSSTPSSPSSSSSPSSAGKPRAWGPKKKKEKDPNAPKKPLSAYMHFVNARRAQVKADHPGLSFTETAKLLGHMWKELPDAEREPYRIMALVDQERYEADMKAYRGSK